MSKDIYVELCERLNQFESKVPPVNAFYKLLQELYTEEEAKTAANFPNGSFTIEELSDKFERDTSGLLPLIETMADKGHVFVLKTDKGENKYELAPWFPGVIEFSILRRLDNPPALKRFTDLQEQMGKEAAELTKELRKDIEAYKAILPPAHLRTLVINEDIPDNRMVHSYEDLLEIVEKEERFAVMPCCCREMAERSDEPCKHEKIPKYSCMNFGKVSDYVVERNFGVRITKEEIKKLIKTYTEAGVVFNSNNFTEGVQYVCGCCGCCCGVLRNIKEIGNLNNVQPSNFMSAVNEDLCTGCGECVDRCPVEAISLEEDIASVNPSVCLGCGSCISICPVGSLSMERKRDEKPEIGDRLIGLGSSEFLTSRD